MVTLNEWLCGLRGWVAHLTPSLQPEARRVPPRVPTADSTEFWSLVLGLSPGLHTNSMNLDQFINHLCLIVPIWGRRIVTVSITRVVVKIKCKPIEQCPISVDIQ